MKILFHKLSEQQISSYSRFVSEVNSYGIKELSSFEIRNILSLVFNQELKNILIDDLFDKNGLILSSETKQDLFNYLTFDEIFYIKNLLSTYLDFQIYSDWSEKVKNLLKSNKNINNIIISKSIFKSDNFLNCITNFFFSYKLMNCFESFRPCA